MLFTLSEGGHFAEMLVRWRMTETRTRNRVCVLSLPFYRLLKEVRAPSLILLPECLSSAEGLPVGFLLTSFSGEETWSPFRSF